MWDRSWEKVGWKKNNRRMEEVEMKMAVGRNGSGMRRHGWSMSRW